MIESNIQSIYANGLASITKESKEIGTILKNTSPYIVGATILKGLQQQVALTTAENLSSYTSTALTGGSYLLIALGVFAFFKTVDPYLTNLGFKKVEKITITKEEFEVMKKEIDRLTQENESLKTIGKQ